jgi:hypothetical protein
MHNPEISAHWSAPQERNSVGNLIPTEKERWAALIIDADKYSLTMSPLKYGPLSIAGYLYARTEQYSIMNHERWKMHPQQIASLLFACQITPEEVHSTLLKHYEAAMPEAVPQDLLVLQHIVLTKLGITPSPSDAVRLIADIPTDRYDHDNEVRDDNTLIALKSFCLCAKDQTVLVDALLSDPAVSLGRYGEKSYLTSLAHYFPDADSEAFTRHCVAFEDYQALSILVKQGRLALDRWIIHVARSSDRTPRARQDVSRRSTSDDEEDHSGRQLDIYGSFATLCSLCTSDDWSQALAKSSLEMPNLAGALLKMGPCPEVDFDGWLSWGCGWAARGLCDTGNPILAKQVEDARLTIKKALIGKPPATLPTISDKSALPVSWFLSHTNPILRLGPAVRDLVAQRLIFGWQKPDTNLLWRTPPARLWFKDTNIADVLCYRWDTKAFNESFDWLVEILPSLPQKLWPGLGARIAQACQAETLKARNVRGTWKALDPEHFGGTIPAQLQRGSLILYAMTRKDPTGVNSMTSALGVTTSSATYRTVVEQWLEQSLGTPELEHDGVTLPEIGT